MKHLWPSRNQGTRDAMWGNHNSFHMMMESLDAVRVELHLLADRAGAIGASPDVMAMIDDTAKGLTLRVAVSLRHLRGLHDRIIETAERTRKREEKVAEQARRRVDRRISELASDSIDHGFDPRGFFVYVLSNRGKPMYVGQSRNVLSRLGQHMTNKDRRYSIDHVALFRCKNERAMTGLEDRLIAEIQPPWNVRGIGPT